MATMVGYYSISASWDPPGVTHDLLEYVKAESIREESLWGGVRVPQNGVVEAPTYLVRTQYLLIPAL